jgi:hypothetical protein
MKLKPWEILAILVMAAVLAFAFYCDRKLRAQLLDLLEQLARLEDQDSKARYEALMN